MDDAAAAAAEGVFVPPASQVEADSGRNHLRLLRESATMMTRRHRNNDAALCAGP